MLKTRIYNCFHDHGSIPDPKYISEIRPALLCGASLDDRNTKDIQFDHLLRDNDPVGRMIMSISYENRQFSELTGYYWIWKSQSDVDVVGIEHYRRHFIRHSAHIEHANVSKDDLLTEKQILLLLRSDDFIVPVHESLCNFSVYDLYQLCFHEQADDIVKNMIGYFKAKDAKYIPYVYKYFSENRLFRGNMLITTKKDFDEYCKVLFDMLYYMKKHMKVKPDSRVWGYVSEVFPMIYIMANEKTFVEADVAIDDEDWETKEKKVHTTQQNKEEDYSKKNPEEIIAHLKEVAGDES